MNPLKTAVVGHTNTGKTSLLRTLLRDDAFGEVQNAAATTRHVEEAAIGAGGETLLLLYDTPGLEDAGGLLDWLEEHTSSREEGIDRIRRFLDSDAAAEAFSQEAKVLRQLLASDCGLYVIDAREPVLPKYRDELTVLSWCAKPLMPVFNFTRGSDTDAWRQMLARRNLHVSSSFDTVAFDFEGEMRLWQNLATMLPGRDSLSRLAASRRDDWQALDRQARQSIASFLLDAAACRRVLDDPLQADSAQAQMQQQVRDGEAALQRELLDLYRFYRSRTDSSHAPLNAFRRDPFDSELLKEYGIRTGTGAAAGALIGLGVDALTLGTSLGMGAAIGGLIGGVLPNWQTLSDKISGTETLYIDAAALTLLAARSLELLTQLQSRGHAGSGDILLEGGRAPWQPEKLPAPLQRARRHPEWSSCNPEGDGRPSSRAGAQADLAAVLKNAAAA